MGDYERSIDFLQYRSYDHRKDKLSEDKIDELTTLFTDSFILMNPIWIKLKVPRQEVQKIMRERVMHGVNFGYMGMMIVPKTGEIAMASIGTDLCDYIQDKKNSSDKSGRKQFLWWKAISELANQLEGDFISSLPKIRWHYYYADMGASKIQYATRYNAQRFWLMAFNNVKYTLGFKFFFGRSSNPISSKLMKKFGSQLPKKVYFKHPEMEQEFMELFILDASKLPAIDREVPKPKL